MAQKIWKSVGRCCNYTFLLVFLRFTKCWDLRNKQIDFIELFKRIFSEFPVVRSTCRMPTKASLKKNGRKAASNDFESPLMSG